MNGLKTILLVEDNPNDVELTLEALADYRLANEVVVLNDGEEALDYLYRRGRFEAVPVLPAVVLLDLKMPKVDGLTVLRTIKADPALKTIPIVMLTSSREERDLVESYELGVNAYVVKPVDFAQFVEAVKKLGYFWAVLNEPAAVRPVPPTPRSESEVTPIRVLYLEDSDADSELVQALLEKRASPASSPVSRPGPSSPRRWKRAASPSSSRTIGSPPTMASLPSPMPASAAPTCPSSLSPGPWARRPRLRP